MAAAALFHFRQQKLVKLISFTSFPKHVFNKFLYNLIKFFSACFPRSHHRLMSIAWKSCIQVGRLNKWICDNCVISIWRGGLTNTKLLLRIFDLILCLGNLMRKDTVRIRILLMKEISMQLFDLFNCDKWFRRRLTRNLCLTGKDSQRIYVKRRRK